MPSSRTLLAALTLTAVCVLAGCGKTATDYGAYSCTPPQGWQQHIPHPAITLAEGLVEFYPGTKEQGAPVLELWLIPDTFARNERIAPLYAFGKERETLARSRNAVRNGEPPIDFERTDVPTVITPAVHGAGAAAGAGETHAMRITFLQGGRETKELVHFIHLPDGRRFRARYTADEPEFSLHEPAINASLATLTFDPPETATQPLSRQQIVAAFKDNLRGDRLWITDGKVLGRTLNDSHLEALSDPAFAEVTDFNVNTTTAMTDGVEVTDRGLEHLKNLPLKSLCLRGSLVTDKGLAHLKDLPLKTLVLGGTLIEGEGLAHLSGMKLMLIDVADTRIDDDDLEHLDGMPLAQVWIRNTNITEDGLTKLKQYAPLAHVDN